MMDSDPSKPALPPDWVKVSSTSAQPGKDYYFNTKNKISVWNIQEALLPKNNRPEHKPSQQQGPRPPKEHDNDSSGTDEIPKVSKKKHRPVTYMPEPPMMYPKTDDMMYGQGMWMPGGFNTPFMPFNPAMQGNFLYGQPPQGMPGNFVYGTYPNMMFPPNAINPSFNQFGPVPAFGPIGQNAGQLETSSKQKQEETKVVDAKMDFQDDSKSKFKQTHIDLRHRIEANKRRRRLSLSGESKKIAMRRMSLPDDSDLKNAVPDESVESSQDVSANDDDPLMANSSVPLKGESYGYWLLKDAPPTARTDLVYVCVDTNIFITCLSIIDSLVDMDKENIVRILIPQCVTVELDRLSKKVAIDRSGPGPYGGMYGNTRPVNLRRLAKKANLFLLDHFAAKNHKFITHVSSAYKRVVKRYNTDDELINCCLNYIENNIHTVLLTLDKNLAFRSMSCNIKVYLLEQMKDLLEEVSEEIAKRDVIMTEVKVIVPNKPAQSTTKNYYPQKPYEIDSDIVRNVPIITKITQGSEPVVISGPTMIKTNESRIPSTEGISRPLDYQVMPPNYALPPPYQNMPAPPNVIPVISHFGPVSFPNIQQVMVSKSQNNDPIEKNNQTKPKDEKYRPKLKRTIKQLTFGEENLTNFTPEKFNEVFTRNINKFNETNKPTEIKAKIKPVVDEGLNNLSALNKELLNTIGTEVEAKSTDTTTTESMDSKKQVTRSIKTKITFKNPTADKKIRLIRNSIMTPDSNVKRESLKFNLSQDHNRVAVSIESTSTNYPSFTTTSALSKSANTPSSKSSVNTVPIADNTQLGGSQVANEVNSRMEETLTVQKIINEKLANSMEEWAVIFEQISTEVLTAVLFSENRFYFIPPPWTLHEALSTLSERCRQGRREISQLANTLAETVNDSCVNKERQCIHYRKLLPASPAIFMQLYNGMRRLLKMLKDVWPITDIEESENLLDNMMKELTSNGMEEEFDLLLGQFSSDETLEITAAEEDYEEVHCKIDDNKHLRVIEFLKKHYDVWANAGMEYYKRELKEKKGEDSSRKTKADGIDADKDNAEKAEQKIAKEPVIVRQLGKIIPEFEKKLDDLLNDDFDEYENNDIYDEWGDYDNENGDQHEEETREEIEDEVLEEEEEEDKRADEEDKIAEEEDKIAEKENAEFDKCSNAEERLNRDELNMVKDKESDQTRENFENEIMDFEYDASLNGNVIDENIQNGYCDDGNENICEVAHAIERSISNCFAFASEQFKQKLGLDPPEKLLGDSTDLPKLPEILNYIHMFAQCLSELLTAGTCNVQLLRSALCALAPRVPGLPRGDNTLLAKCGRIVKTTPDMKTEVDFMHQTHSVLQKFHQEYHINSDTSDDRNSRAIV